MKYALLLITSMAFSTIAYSQHFTDQGNTWVLGEFNWDLETGAEYQIKIDRDTLINNQEYKTVYRADDAYNPVWYKLNFYLREDDQQIVYILDSTGQEGILYHFGLEPGEQVILWNGIMLTVKSIDSIEVANQGMQKNFHINAKRMGLTGWDCSSYMQYIDEVGVGPIPNLFCPVEDISYGLGCFFRDETSLYWPIESSWCSGFVTATESIEQSTLKIFPNPVTDELTLQFDKDINLNRKIQLYNSQGQVMYQHISSDPSLQIDMSQMASGIYFLQIFNEDHDLRCRKIVKL